MEKKPQIRSKRFNFQKPFFLIKENIIIKRGPNPAIKVPNTESPAPDFICRKTPTNGAIVQIEKETKFGLVFL